CDDVSILLNARADGELRAEDVDALDAHLAECEPCRLTAESLKAIDADLRGAFAPRREAAARLAEDTVAAVRVAATESAAVTPPIPFEPRFAWPQLLVGLAAGFLLAVVLFRPWQSRSDGPDLLTQTKPVAQLAIATGPVEMKLPSQVEFFTCPKDASIGQDSTVRTGPSARCELALNDG